MLDTIDTSLFYLITSVLSTRSSSFQVWAILGSDFFSSCFMETVVVENIFQIRVLHFDPCMVFLCFRMIPPENLFYIVTEQSQMYCQNFLIFFLYKIHYIVS